jgi:5-methylcytosine-specific restriction protein B
MREADFRQWLDKRLWRGTPLTDTAKNSRFRRVQRVERGLSGLGFAEPSLEAAFDAGRWGDLLQRLAVLKDDPAADPAAVKSVVPEAEDPTGQLGNLLAATTQYGYFLEGRDPNYGASEDVADSGETLGLTRESVEKVMDDYDRSGSAFMQKYGFAENYDYVVFRPREAQQYPAKAVFLVAYSAIPGNPDLTAKGQRDRFRDAEGGPIHAEFRRLGYEVENRRRGVKEILADRIRAHLIAHYVEPARQRGDQTVTIRAGDVHKELGLTAQLPNVCQAIEGEKFRGAAGLGEAEIVSGPSSGRGSNMVYRFALAPGENVQAPLSDAQLLARFDGNADFRTRRPTWTGEQCSAFCRMARAVHSAGLDWYHTDIPQVRFGRKSQGNRAEGTLGSVQFRRTGPFLTFSHQNELLGLAGDYPFDAGSADRFESDMADAQSLIGNWRPNAAHRAGKWPDEYGPAEHANNESDAMILPTNLILYGPPGTGKTYRTAREAVALCDGQARYPETREGRDALMVRYNELVASEQIGFVTFHQNYGYEDFVEGLRPTTYGEDGEPLTSGFRLAPEAGIFTKIVERAQALHSASDGEYDFADKRFFKMSLGEVANPEDDYLFEEAIAGNFVHMGGDGGMDWSEPVFTTKDLMIAGYAEKHPDEPVQHPNNGIIEFPFRLRVRARVGDLVIVSKGNLLFRAIGEITGDYHQVKRENDDYTMRRSVKWLWVDRDGVSHDVIYGKRFSQRTIYEFTESELKLDAIRGLIEAGKGRRDDGPAKQFVLIIDEINRANVSKVFGELITLLEPDKRAGMENALTVTLPYSKRPFSVPANLHIIGTMNTADRSIALLDTALRRRFNFREMAPEPRLLMEASGLTGIDLVAVLTTINQRIEYLIDREHRIGHAFFIGCTTAEQVKAAMRDKVIPLLQEYFFEDWSRIHAVLGNGFVQETKLDPPPGIEGDPVSAWSVRSPYQPDAFVRLTGKTTSEPEGAGA